MQANTNKEINPGKTYESKNEFSWKQLDIEGQPPSLPEEEKLYKIKMQLNS